MIYNKQVNSSLKIYRKIKSFKAILLEEKIDFFIYKKDKLNKYIIASNDKNNSNFDDSVSLKKNDLILYKTSFKDKKVFSLEYIEAPKGFNYNFTFIIIRCNKSLNPLYIKKIFNELEYREIIQKIVNKYDLSYQTINKLKKITIPVFSKSIQTFILFTSYIFNENIKLISLLDSSYIRQAIKIHRSLNYYKDIIENNILIRNEKEFLYDFFYDLEPMIDFQENIEEKLNKLRLDKNNNYSHKFEIKELWLNFKFPFNIDNNIYEYIHDALYYYKSLMEYYLYLNSIIEKSTYDRKNKMSIYNIFKYLKNNFFRVHKIENTADEKEIISQIVVIDRKNWENKIIEKEKQIIMAVRHNVSPKLGMIINSTEMILDEYHEKKTSDIPLKEIESIKINAEQAGYILKRMKQIFTKDIPEEDFIPTNLEKLFQEISIKYEQHNFKILTKVNNNLVATICKKDIIMVFDDLINNAINHGFIDHKKEYKINIRINEDSKYIIIDYINDGNPWPKDFTIYDFTKFLEKGKNSKGEGIGGTTIKRIIDLHHGSINLVKDDNPVHFKIKIPKERIIDGI